MTLGEMKKKVYSVIEEYSDTEELTSDEDLATKMNTCVNMIQNEISRLKKIHGYTSIQVEKETEYDLNDIAEDLYQLNLIKGIDYDITGNRVTFNDDGEAKIYYYKYPTQINDETTDDYEFELDIDALEIMPYGIAGLLLASDISNAYGKIYTDLYKDKISQLDSRKTMNTAYIYGGVDI